MTRGGATSGPCYRRRMPNLDLVKKKDMSAFRRIAIGTWQTAYDPQVYGTLEVRMEKSLQYIADFRAKVGKRITITHLVSKAIAMALKEMPDANAVLRYNSVYLRKRIGVFMQVAMTDEGAHKADLSGATIYDVEQKSLAQLADEIEAKVAIVRARKDPALESTRQLFFKIPAMLLNVFLKTLSFFSFTLNLDLRWAGIPSDPFGSVMVTNVGSIGLDVAYPPLVPYAKVPLLLATGAVKDKAVVDDGKLAVGKVMNINATFDHRFIDGFHASIMSKMLREWLEKPYEHFDKLPSTEQKAS